MSLPSHTGNPPPLVGRARELGVLRAHLDATLAGTGSLVLIGGEAGIGKTALAEIICREAAEQGALVLVGRCFDLTETPPYGPWIELFARYQPTDDMPPPPAFATRGIVGDVPSQAALFQQLADFFAALTIEHPVALLLDDLHWADPASLDLVRFLARTVTTLPLLLFATYRSDEVSRGHPLYGLLPVFVREAGAVRVDLGGLAPDAIHALIRARYALAATDEARLARYLSQRAEGNALFTLELLRTLEESGDLHDEGRRLGEFEGIHMPTLLRQVIDARLVRLGGEGQRLLETAAVIGQEVPLDVWAAVAEVDEDALAEAIERAVGAGLAEEAPEGDRVRFRHALVREAVYMSVPAVRRRRLHRQVGEVLASATLDPDAVAYHFRQAGDTRATEWLVRAGDRALRAYAWLTAHDRYEAALALMERDGVQGSERGWALYRLSQTLQYRDPQRGQAYLDEAVHQAATGDDRPLLALATFNQGFLRCLAGDYRGGLTALETGGAALEALSDVEMERVRQHDPMASGVRAARVFWLATLGRCDEAIAMGERAAAGYHGLHTAYATMGRTDDADRAFRHLHDLYSRDLADEHFNELGSLILEHLSFVTLPFRATNTAERARLAEEGERAYRQASDSWSVSTISWVRMPLLLLEGVWDEAERAALAWRDSGRSGTTVALRILGPLARWRGAPEAAWACVWEGIPAGLATEPGEARFLDALMLQRLATALAIDAGDLPDARQWLEAHDRWLAWNGAILGRSEGGLGWAGYYRAAGETRRAIDYAQRALIAATEPRQPLALLAAHRLLGELGTGASRYDDAASHLDTSLALADACAAPFERALTLFALAELRAAQGRRAEAETLIDEVRVLCIPLGAQPTLDRADALASRLATMKGAPQTYPAGLSAREVEVLRLVAEGLTNAQVAERLFVSPHTINAHLTTIYAKLDVPSRAAAIRFALDHGLR